MFCGAGMFNDRDDLGSEVEKDDVRLKSPRGVWSLGMRSFSKFGTWHPPQQIRPPLMPTAEQVSSQNCRHILGGNNAEPRYACLYRRTRHRKGNLTASAFGIRCLNRTRQ
jgi:hypothetical protein